MVQSYGLISKTRRREMPRPTQPGKYNAKAKEIAIANAKSGALMAVINCELEDGSHIRSYNIIISKDGVLNERNVAKLKDIFGWDGTDPFWLAENYMGERPFNITVDVDGQNEDGTPRMACKWIDPISSGSKPMSIESADKREVMAKFGAQFRAFSGTVAKKPSPAPASAPAKATTPVAMPKAPMSGASKAKPITVDDAWLDFVRACDGLIGDAERDKLWTEEFFRVAGDAKELSDAQAGEVLNACILRLPPF
jgi:hypothetical protein